MSADEKDTEDIQRLKIEIIFLKRKIEHLKFKNSLLFRILNIINRIIFMVFVQYIISYLFEINVMKIQNHNIEFKTYPYEAEQVKLYTIVFKYHHYFFKVRINKELDRTIIYSDAMISQDLIFRLPQKFKLLNLNNKWFLVYESLGILTICLIIVFVQVVAFLYKLNESFYSLFSISMLSIISFIGIIIFSAYIHNFI